MSAGDCNHSREVDLLSRTNGAYFLPFLPDTIRGALMPVRAWERSDTPQRSEDSESLAIYRENSPALQSRLLFCHESRIEHCEGLEVPSPPHEGGGDGYRDERVRLQLLGGGKHGQVSLN